ncbi:MAG: GNAT family N-acetyltransferase [archaeon]|nr:MAG: GNAT family N-acetyltransferase [archaeon]
MRIRRVKKTDLEEIAKLYKRMYSKKPYCERWNEKNLMIKLKENIGWMKFFVAEENKKIIGFIMFYIYLWSRGWNAYIEDVGVVEEYRRQGVGKRLIKFAISFCKKKKARIIVLNTNTKAKAINIYKKFGFKKTKNFIQMTKNLYKK